MLINWLTIFVYVLLFGCGPADAAEVYGPSPQQPGGVSIHEEEQEKVPFIDDDGHPAEHALKSLPAKSEYTIIPLPSFSYNRNEKSNRSP